MDAKRELVDTSLLPAEVEDPDLGVRHTTAEPGLGVRLVLAVTVATGWSAPHLERPSLKYESVVKFTLFNAFSTE